jgi:hypothetical protein
VTGEAQAILEDHVGELPREIEALTEKFLAGMTAFERSRGRSVAEGCEWAALSRAELYRAVERGEIVVERAEAPRRKNGRAPATKIVLTYAELARFRAARMTSATAAAEKGRREPTGPCP